MRVRINIIIFIYINIFIIIYIYIQFFCTFPSIFNWKTERLKGLSHIHLLINTLRIINFLSVYLRVRFWWIRGGETWQILAKHSLHLIKKRRFSCQILKIRKKYPCNEALTQKLLKLTNSQVRILWFLSVLPSFCASLVEKLFTSCLQFAFANKKFAFAF